MFKDRAKARRNELKLRQADIAERLGTSTSTVSDWETGKRVPGIDEIGMIAKAYETTAHMLMGWDDEFLPDNILPIHRRMIPVLGDVAAGEPIWAEEEYDEFVDDNGTAEADFALRVKGDSMSPLILDGDFVYVRQQEDVRDGQIAVVLTDDSATLKTVYHQAGGLQLISINQAYPPMFFNETNSHELKILGLAVSFKRALIKN